MKTIKLTGEYALQCPELDSRIPLGYVDKTICGCGITTVALENNRNTIILVPNTNLIKNKCSQYPNERVPHSILGVYGGVTKEEILEYLENNNLIKVLVTYDSLYRVEHLLEKCDIIVDESDRLLANTKLKVSSKKDKKTKDVVSALFDTLEKYKDKVSFVSATPIPTEYMPKWVDELPKIKLEWEGTATTIPYIMSRGKPYNSLVHEILKPIATEGSVVINDMKVTKVLVFLNSISNIKKVIQSAKLPINEVGYIAGESVNNDIKLNKYKRITDANNLPKYTFITSTGFQGIDLYDKEAVSVVVSSTGQQFTMIDISTDLKQAISRQRDKSNPNYGKYVFIYDQNLFDEEEEVLLKRIETLKNKIKEGIKLYDMGKENNLNEGIELLSDNAYFIAYTTYDNIKDNFILNENAFNADKYFLLETRKQYKKGFQIRSLDTENIMPPVELPREVIFSDLARYLKKELKTKSIEEVDWKVYSTRVEWIELLKSYYKIYNKVILNYSRTKNLVEAASSTTDQVKAEVQSKFKKGKTYSRKEVKIFLNKLYEEYKVNKKANHRDLYTWFKIRERRIKGYDHLDIIDIIK